MSRMGGIKATLYQFAKAKRRNVDGSTKLIVFCLQNYRCQVQCEECLKWRNEWEQKKKHDLLPKVIYVPPQ